MYVPPTMTIFSYVQHTWQTTDSDSLKRSSKSYDGCHVCIYAQIVSLHAMTKPFVERNKTKKNSPISKQEFGAAAAQDVEWIGHLSQGCWFERPHLFVCPTDTPQITPNASKKKKLP